MKKVLVLGSIVTDLYNTVQRLPQANEPFEIAEGKIRTSGSAYTCGCILNGFGFPYVSLSVIGSGVYGDAAAKECDEKGIPYIRSEDIAGCTYTLEDRSGQKTSIAVPGCEYETDYSFFQDLDKDEISMAVVFGGMLCGESSEDLIRGLEDLSVPVLFIPTDRIFEADEDAVNALLQLNPSVFMSDEQGCYLCGEDYEELSQMAEDVYTQLKQPVYVYQPKEGVYCTDGEETWIAPADRKGENPDHVIGAFVTALSCGVDSKNAMMFAMHFGTLRRKGMPTAFDYEEQKHRLVEILKGI